MTTIKGEKLADGMTALEHAGTRLTSIRNAFTLAETALAREYPPPFPS